MQKIKRHYGNIFPELGNLPSHRLKSTLAHEARREFSNFDFGDCNWWQTEA